MSVVVLALGCSFPSTTPRETQVVRPPTEAGEVELVFVHASLLRLREHPRPDSAFSTLAINTRVRVLERKDDWVRILAPDGRSGWVHRDFIGGAPLTPEVVEQKLAAASTPEDRVLWSERASALRPGDSGLVLRLIGAYRDAGKVEEATALEATLHRDESSRFDRMFPVHAPQVAQVSEEIARAGTAGALITAWQHARDLSAAMGEPLAAGFDPRTHTFLDGDPTAMFVERMPWATLALYAEGTVPALELAPRVWLDAAARTPEPWDDGFFSLVTTAYENASARGWTAWQRRSWDYGGCSPFGSGEMLHLALLKQTDTLAGIPPIAEMVGFIRSTVLKDIEKPAPDEFPYCDNAGRPTPIEGLLTEARTILAEVKLAPEERSMIESRAAAQFGR